MSKKGKKIVETKCTCKACGNVWFYGKSEAIQNFGERMENTGKSMSNTGTDLMCCGGCLPALFMPKATEKQVRDLNQCDNCGSKAIMKEKVEHYV